MRRKGWALMCDGSDGSALQSPASRRRAKALVCNSWQRHSRDLMCFAKTKNRLASRRHGMLCLRWKG